jgi:hypothetical protein
MFSASFATETPGLMRGTLGQLSKSLSKGMCHQADMVTICMFSVRCVEAFLRMSFPVLYLLDTCGF